MLKPRQTGETAHSEDEWFIRRDGSMFPIAWWSAPIAMENGNGAVLAFTDSERRATEQAVRERDAAETTPPSRGLRSDASSRTRLPCAGRWRVTCTTEPSSG